MITILFNNRRNSLKNTQKKNEKFRTSQERVFLTYRFSNTL